MNKQAIHAAAAEGQSATLSLLIHQHGIDPNKTTSDVRVYMTIFGILHN